jgi:hypothetical protein
VFEVAVRHDGRADRPGRVAAQRPPGNVPALRVGRCGSLDPAADGAGFILHIWREALKDSRPATVDGVDSSWDEIREALAHINPDCSRQDWIQAGMAIKWAGSRRSTPTRRSPCGTAGASKAASIPA